MTLHDTWEILLSNKSVWPKADVVDGLKQILSGDDKNNNVQTLVERVFGASGTRNDSCGIDG